VSVDEPAAPPGEARALIGATWEALAEERARAARARRNAEGRIAELEQALAAAREGTAEADSDGVALAAQLRRQRDELRAQVRAGEHALREAETQRDRLATRLRRRERDQDRARQVAQELENERSARRAAQDERDELAALLERERAAHRATRAVAPETQPSAPPARRPDTDARTARARAEERERQLRSRAAEKVGRAVEQKRSAEHALAQAISDRDSVDAELRAAREDRALLVAQIEMMRSETGAVSQALDAERALERERESLRKAREREAETLAQQGARIQALESVNARVTEAARRDGAARAELTTEMQRLAGERDELEGQARSEAKAREQLEGRVTELEHSAQRAAEQAAIARRAWADSEAARAAERGAGGQEHTLAQQGARIEALESVNARVTEAARREGAARAELTAEVERLKFERDELEGRGQEEAQAREQLEQRVAELERDAHRAAEQAAVARRAWADSEAARQAERQP
jgi:chromosome segregation ATPase